MTRPLTAALALTATKAQLKPSQVAPELLRGQAPYSDQDYAELQQLGVRTVLDLRGDQPFASFIERRRVEAMGMTYRKVRFGFQPLRDGSDAAVLAAMQNTADYPMYVHCNIDRDRTSVAVAAYRVKVQGWTRAAATIEAKSYGLKRYFLGLNRYFRALSE